MPSGKAFRRVLPGLAALVLPAVFTGVPALSQDVPVLRLAVQDLPGFSRVTMSSSLPLEVVLEKQGQSLFIHVGTKSSFRIQGTPASSRLIESLGWSRAAGLTTVVVGVKTEDFAFDYRVADAPWELVVDLKPAEKAKPEAVLPLPAAAPPPEKTKNVEAAVTPPAPPPEAAPVSVEPVDAERRVRTVVIDPGHGGMETGAKGKFGGLEKDVTLAISLRLKTIIERNQAFRVVLTRDKDTDVSLENRSALANNHKADLFISIHANGSLRKKARGSETFFLSLNATDEESRRLAYLENNSSHLEGQIEEGSQDDVKMILWDMAQSVYLKQSSRLAEIIQAELNEFLETRNRGIKQAPFRVLTGVACPAILVEAAFISNPEEEQKLASPEFQENVAQAIYRGLALFLNLSP